MKKIIFLGKLPPPYIGPAIAAGIILNSDLKNRYEIIHLDTSDHRAITTLAKIDLGNLFAAIKQYFKLFYLLLKEQPDAVYIPSQQTTVGYLRDIVFFTLTKLFRKKLICHLRGGNFKNWYESSSKVMQKLVRFYQERVDAQIVLSKNLIPIFSFCMPEEKIFVVPNGADYPELDKIKDETCLPAGRDQTHLRQVFDGQGIKVLYLANFIKTKGYLDVLYSSKYLAHMLDKVEFHFAGNWRDDISKKEFEEFVKKHPDLRVVMHGQVSGAGKFELLLSSDIFVFPTYYPNEGHPWVLVEAMAAGLPVISTEHAAIPETVSDRVNGFLVEKRNPEAIAEKIILLIENEDLRKKMGNESRRIYEEKFTEEKLVENLDRVFKKVTGE